MNTYVVTWLHKKKPNTELVDGATIISALDNFARKHPEIDDFSQVVGCHLMAIMPVRISEDDDLGQWHSKLRRA